MLVLTFIGLVASGCQPVTTSESGDLSKPVVDTKKSSSYEADLAECENEAREYREELASFAPSEFYMDIFGNSGPFSSDEYSEMREFENSDENSGLSKILIDGCMDERGHEVAGF